MNSQIVTCQNQISHLSISHCGLLIAAASKTITAERHRVYLLSYPTLQTLSIISGHEKPILSLNFTYNSRLLISSSCDSYIRLWPINPNLHNTMNPKWEIFFPDYHFQSIATNKSGQYIACGDQQGRVAVWSILQKTMTMRWQGLSGCVTTIQIVESDSQIQYIVIGGNSNQNCSCSKQPLNDKEIYGEIKIWSWGTQELLHTFAQAESCNYLVEIFQHWALLADDQQVMLVNTWPDISNFNLNKLDHFIEPGIYQQIQGIEWFKDGLHYLIFTKQGTIVQYTFEKESNQIKSNQNINIKSSLLEIMIPSNSNKENSISKKLSKLGDFLKKTGPREMTYDRLVFKNKIKFDFNQQLNDAKFSGEHDYMILAFDDHTLLNYDLKYKETPYKKVGIEGTVFSVRFSPCKNFLAIGDENGYLIMIDRSTLNIVSKTQPHNGCIDCIDFFPNGDKMVTKSKDMTFKIWIYAPELEEIQTIEHDSDSNLAISSDGLWILVGNNDGSLTIHNTKNWSSMQLASYQVEITAVCFAQNSDILISANLDKMIILTDNKQKEIIKKFEGHADPIIALASSPDGSQFASGGWDFVIKLWSITKKIFIGNLIGHKDCVNQLRYSPDGNVLFSCSNDRSIKLWSIQKMEIIININIEDYAIQSFDVIYDERIICFAQEDQVLLWFGKEQKAKFNYYWNEEVGAICYTSSKNFMATSIGQTIQLMNVTFESQMNLLRDKTTSQQNMMENQEMKCNSIVKKLSFSYGRIYATCQDGQIYVFNINTFSILHTFKDQECVASFKNNRLIITAEEQQINIWDGKQFELLKTLPMIWVNNISISDNEQIIVCSNQKMLCVIWDLENYQEETQFKLHQKQIYDIKFGQRDKCVGSAGEDKIIFIWPTNGKGEAKQLKGHTDTINCFCFINNDTHILSGGDEGIIKYWKIATEELIHNLALHSMPIRCIICNEDSAQFSYCFGSNIIVANLHRDILSDIQIEETDCRPLLLTQNFQLISPNGILSRHLGTVFRPQLKNQFILDDELKNSASFLSESSVSGSQLFAKIRQQLLNPKERQQLLDHLSKSEFLLQTFDDDLAYAMFNQIYESLREINYDNLSSFVQNMFYSVLNCQTAQGKRTLQEMFRQQKFSQHLSMKELQYLLSLAKFLKQHILNLHNASKYRAWYDKIINIRELNLQKNSYLSSLLCKSQLLMNMDKTFQTFKLLTPQEIMQNEHFNLFKNEDFQPKCFTYTRSLKIEKQILQISKLRDKIAQFNFDEFDNYIQDFIFELILELEGLESIDLSYLNLTDEFCEQFCNTFINREYCPDLQIFSNERISHVGQKYLQVLFTKHKSSKLNLHSLNQRKQVQENLKNKIKLLETENFRKRFNPDQIELLKFDMNELTKNLNEQLTELKQQDDFLSIQEYFERQSENLKRSQALLNFGILGYLNQLIFTKSVTDYCIFCNKYVCIECHQQKHETQQSCVLCFNCFQFHQGFSQVLTCTQPDNFNVERERQVLYQKFKFEKSVCLYGQLKILEKIYAQKNKVSAILTFKFKCKLFNLIEWISFQIQDIQIYIMFQLSRIVKSKPQSQEDIKAGLFEQLQVLAIDQYNFNNNVFDLEEKIQKPSYLIFTIILFFLWYFFALTLPIVFPGKQTVKWEAHFIFLAYLAVVFVGEYQVIRYMMSIVNKPVEGEVKLIRDLSPLKYFSLLFSTAFAKYDFYTDVIFVTILYRQKDNQEISLLFDLSLIFTILPALITLVQSIVIISSEVWSRFHQDKENQKTLRCINFYSRLSILLEHESIGWLLDKFASNTAIKIGRNYVPQKIISSFFKVVFENMPQLVIQMIYQLKLSQDSNFTLILTTITTTISLIMQVFVFLMAKSSFVNEIDQSKMSQRLGFGLSRKQTEEEKDHLKIQLIEKEQKSSRNTVEKNVTRSRISRVSEAKKQFDSEMEMEIELVTNREQTQDTILQL